MNILHKNTLHVISDWKQAKEIQDRLISTYLSSNTVPCINNEWYSQQDIIEWHNLEEADWKKHISNHLKDIRRFNRVFYKNGISLVIVLWNAQLLMPHQQYFWKDLPGDIVVHMVSTKYLPFVKNYGFILKKYEIIQNIELRQKLIKPINDILKNSKIDWKQIVVFRDEIISYLDWNDALVPLKQVLSNIMQDIMPSLIVKRPDASILLANAKDKLSISFAAEYCFMLILKFKCETLKIV